MAEQKPVRFSWKQVNAFRLARHHLSERARSSALVSILGDIVGAQAQVLQAAQLSLGARVAGSRVRDVDAAIWKDHSLVRAWCMRRTMFLVPARDLAIFIRGTTRRPAYVLRWALSRIGSKERLDKLLDGILEALDEPRTRTEIARMLIKSHGYKMKSKLGGGWGSKRPVPWIDVGGASFQVGHLLHAMGTRDAICSGPNRGAESTYVRADKWVKNWKDIPVRDAERMLLNKYLRAFGPSTLADFALWAGFYVRDARQVWEQEADNIVPVDVEGWKAHVLRSDLSDLESMETDKPSVRLLPYFDSYLLGHKSHRNIVDEKNHRKIYRPQGWVSPVLLVDGRAAGVWSHEQGKRALEVRVSPFTKLSNQVISKTKDEAAELGRFLESPDVKTTFD
jgi:Winged helix DNA-binding domain